MDVSGGFDNENPLRRIGRCELIGEHSIGHAELFIVFPGREFGSSVGLSLVIGLQENDVISGLESEILREKTRQFQLDHELVIGTRDLEVMSCLGLMRGQNQGRFLLEGIKLAMKVLVVVGENVLKGWVREELGPFVKLKLAISLCHFPR